MQKGFLQPITKLYHKNPLNAGNFILSGSNQEVYLYISKWPNWYGNSCLIQGKKGTGKTYLSQIWQKNSNAFYIDLYNLTNKELDKILNKGRAFILDDFQKYFCNKSLLRNLKNHDFNNIEQVIIKIFDLCKNQDKNLLITTDIPSRDLNIKMADLKSRIQAANVFNLEVPDQSALHVYLVELFSENQLRISPNVIKYISKNVQKSYKEANIIFDAIDSFSLQQKRNITIPLVKDVLARE